MNTVGQETTAGESINSLEKCPACNSVSILSNSLCAACLLKAALEPSDEESDTLESTLAAIDVSDADWTIGNYQILEEIGRGGMGVIYQARQRHSRRIVALKRLLIYSADCPDTLVRFRREVEAAASLDHPNILPIYEVCESDGVPFFSMKFAVGGSVRNAGAIFRNEPRKAVTMLAKVVRAVAYAHNHGILHRDLKPGNILLDGTGEPLVSDFGLAKWLDATTDLTRTLSVFGTPGYIAPEQAHSAAASLTPAADIYSLGAILFELLTGRPPFIGEHAFSVIQQAAATAAPKLRTLNKSLDRDLETICARCLEREPSARYESAAELATDLEHWRDGKPIRARPVSPPVTLWRWSRRNPPLALVAAACVFLSAAVIWLGITRWEMEREANRMAAKNSGPLIPEKSLAVLPFENLSREKANDFFVDGIQEDILQDLARIADLKVISRDSVQLYKAGLPRDLAAIAHTLNVRYVVEGEGRRDANGIRISVQLIDATTGARRWAEHYDRDPKDFFTIKAEVAQAIAHQLHAHITSRENAEIQRRPTADLKAYGLYLQARRTIETAVLMGQTGKIQLQGVRLLEEAVQRDPKFFEAYYELVWTNGVVYVLGYDHTPHRLAELEKALHVVVRMRPNSGEAHFATAQDLYFGHLDYDGARRELLLAEKFLPNDAEVIALRGYVNRRQGRWDESTKNFLRALDLNPREFQLQQETALSFLLQRRFSEMAAVINRALAIMPQHAPTRILQALVAYGRLGDTRPLRDTIAAIVTADKRAAPRIAQYWFWLGIWERDLATIESAIAVMPPDGLTVDSVRFPRAWCEFIAARMHGDVSLAHNKLLQARQEVAEIVHRQPNFPVMLSVLGLIDADLGRKDLAIAEGRKAVESLPLSKDSLNGFHAITYLAIIYAWTGETDRAFEELQLAVSIPSDVNYGNLLLDPAWDPLRADPRFEKILSSLAPK